MNKKQLSLALSALLILGGCSSSPSKTSSGAATSSTETGSSAVAQTLTLIELHPLWERALVQEETDLNPKTEPEVFVLDVPDFQTSGGVIVMKEGRPHFRADEPGSYTVFVDRDGVKSNTVTIQVIGEDDPEAESVRADHESKAAQASSENSDSTAASQSSVPDSEAASAPADSSGSGNEASAPAGSENTQTIRSGVTVSEVLASPETYVNQRITVTGLLPQNASLDENGNPIIMLLPDTSGSEGLILVGNNDIPFGGSMASIAGILIQRADGQYVFQVDRAEQTMRGGDAKSSAAVSAPVETASGVGTPVSSMPSSGTFQFTADGIRIRHGMEGLAGAASSYVFNAGMSVHYDGIYTQDGYTWITYLSYTGTRYSAAIGDDTTVLYGYLVS